jgi:PKD repeat protein
VNIETGTDGNNLLDNCDRGIADGQSLPVTVFPVVPTPMDSLSAIGCAPDVLELVFRSRMFCSSIAANGSDFIVTGPSSVTVSGAEGACNADGFTDIIRVRLSAPVQNAGTFGIKLQEGTDGNTIINECGVPTVSGSFINFTTKDTVSALFKYNIGFGCIADTVAYTHDGRNGVNSWKWSFDGNVTSIARDTAIIFRSFGLKQATLIVSNGTCTDSATAVVLLDNNVTANFESTEVVCPGDPAVFTDNSSGPVITWNWNFGNGGISTDKVPGNNFIPPLIIQLISRYA